MICRLWLLFLLCISVMCMLWVRIMLVRVRLFIVFLVLVSVVGCWFGLNSGFC